MVRLYLLLFLIVGGYFLVRSFLAAPKAKQDNYKKSLIIGSVILFVVILATTGHLAWLPALLGVVLAFIARNLPVLLRYAPFFQRLWQGFRRSKPQSDSFQGQYTRSAAHGATMTVTEAYKILGLTPNASKDDIIQAHKKLIQKMHPDRGGSDYLAAQINLAKDVLLRS